MTYYDLVGTEKNCRNRSYKRGTSLDTATCYVVAIHKVVALQFPQNKVGSTRLPTVAQLKRHRAEQKHNTAVSRVT